MFRQYWRAIGDSEDARSCDCGTNRRGFHHSKVCTAIARELIAFAWDIAEAYRLTPSATWLGQAVEQRAVR